MSQHNDVVVAMPDASKGVGVFSWANVSYEVLVPKTKEYKTLLHGMYGEIQAGEVVAIMGGSDILVDGAPRDAATWRLQCAFVEQDDVMFRNLSVLETLTYSANLRLPSSMPKSEKAERVERVIASLGLNGCRDTWIGDELTRGISGGERKRVSIGIELVTDPQILFLDEPTSGLDAFNSLNIISTIKDVAVKQKKIVLMTIHQPRTDIINLFDKLILLSMGKTIWFGSTQELRNLSRARIEKFVSAYEEIRKQTHKEIATSQAARATLGKLSRVQWPSSWTGELATLLQRNAVDLSRDKATLGASLGQSVFLFIVIGFIFFKLSADTGGVQSRVGLLFFICINQTFGVVMPTISVFPIQRIIIRRERAGGSYRSSSAYIAKVISSLPLPLIGCLVFGIPVYWMTGLQAQVNKFFTFVCILLIHAFSANALGLMIGAGVPDVRVGLIIGPLINIIFILFGGHPSLWMSAGSNLIIAFGFYFIGYLLFDRTSRPLLRLK
nr:ATP-binding cassette sub- G member 2 [Polyrhizophydium stewartii]